LNLITLILMLSVWFFRTW